jgi:uncharacterized membrane protein YjgN (DUF898 family)
LLGIILQPNLTTMENQTYGLKYHGDGLELFKIKIVNLILCAVTLGLYYPWAKAKTLSYLYSQTSFENQPFVFTGTGNQMFKGFIKAFAFIIALYMVAIICALRGGGFAQLVLLFFYLVFLSIIPLVLHGSYRYRMAKTEWRGIRFGYDGVRRELVKLFFRDLFFTIISFGIYGAWFAINIRKYILSHIRMGNARFDYRAHGSDYFILNLKGYFLTIFTLGIYMFWWQKDIFEFYVNNLRITDGEKKVKLTSTATGGGFAGLMIVNILIIVFTLGLGFAWVETRTLVFVMERISLNGDINFDELVQTQPDYSDATADDMADFFDFGFVI